jgi:hypothetical protein
MKTAYIACAIGGMVLGGCGGDDDPGPRFVQQVSVPGVNPGANFSFDLGLVSGGAYYLSDRSSRAVDVLDIATLKVVSQIAGSGANAFAGLQASNAVSGPDGLNVVGSLLYAGDVNSVKVIDPTARQVLKTIVVGSAGVRADEGCLDAVHGLYMISTPEAPTPFATFIDAATQAVVAQVTFTDASGAPAAGLEQCRYDPGTDTFYVNNDGTTANPHGELVALPGTAIRAIPAGGTVNYTALAGMAAYSEGNCDPTGLALGPGTDIAVSCREGSTGVPLLVQIMNRSTGAIVASVNAGGGDQLEYDAQSNRYYNAASRWTASGLASTGGACSAASPCTPVLQIIDAATHQVVARLPTGNNAHSVAVDPQSGLAFVPHSSAAVPAGCATCSANGFTDPGIAVFAIR